MSSLADARFLMTRALSLARRGLVSLRTRGWRASLARVRLQLRPGVKVAASDLFAPAADAFSPFAVPHADPAPGAPRASIVIPVYNHFAHTLACLRALAAHPSAARCEVIVVDDGSSDETITALPQVAGLRYHRRARNGGFIAACNDGARVALGEVLVFLNNDTVPQPGWLDALLATFDADPKVGLAGAQLLYPDGRLQEAGGVVFSDGSGWNYGRFESPDDPRYAYLRDVHYASGAAIAIPRALFEQLGGFDSRYAPAYYEDTDLAFAVRAAGRRVVYQPAARVVHDEGTSSGTDTASGMKAYQLRNRDIFAAHRRDALATHPAPGTLPSPATLHRGQRQVLVIDALTPQPDHDSGSLRLVNLMRMLREDGAHVVFLPANRAHAGRYTRELQQLGVETWHAPFAARAPAWLREHGPRFDRVLLCRHYVASEFLPLLRQHAPQARILFDTIDLHYLREQRAAEVAGDASLLRAAARTRALELAVIAAADTTLVVSEAERALLAIDAPQAQVDVLSNLHRVAGAGQPFAQRQDLVFVGGFRHPPNTDAVRWFVEDVFPAIRAQLPQVRFHCIGSDMPAGIRALGERDGVVMHGHVPDITPYMDGCRIALAPLRYGAGVKGKVNLSMAHGQPVVATACAVEGMHLVDGRDVLVADDAAGFATRVVRLYRDQALWEQLAHAGLDNVRRHFSIDAARDTVRRLFLE
ncbi:glycosyltransferase [Cognatiluteimonas telluris]|jgi:GT2 family glycosyltransferase|uniref:glycosyltransferase n=1 Tax=Cognatiluteimonas telluris TaxID=1104775 RepID=UPI0014097831|nr:glycosyltransferase [Lysobacter telluris]